MATRIKPRRSYGATPSVVPGVPRPVVELRNGLPINFGSSGNVKPAIAGGVINSLKLVNRQGFRNPNTSAASADYVDLGTSADICTVPFTYFFEFSLDATNDTTLAVSAQGALSNCIQFRASSNALLLIKQNAALILTTGSVLSINKRHRAAVTYDGTTCVIVTDGRTITTGTSSQTFTHGTFAICGGRGSGTENYANTISIFRMWGQVLSIPVLLRMTAPDANPRNGTYAVAVAGGGIVGPLIGARHLLGGGALIGGRLAFDRHERGVHA